jgi:hypothetical protein
MKRLQLLLMVLVWCGVGWAQGGTAESKGVVQAHLFSGETADAKIRAAVSSLAGRGGVIDARGVSGIQTINATVTIPANTTVQLNPDVIYLCNVKDAPCWSLNGNGAKLLGYAGGNIDEDDVPASKQTGTVLRMGPGITSKTDMIAVNPAKAGRIAGVEIGGLTIDFANLRANTGRYGIVTYGINQSWLHDIVIFNAGSDGFRAETFGDGIPPNDGVSYDVTLNRVFVRAVGANGFHWYTGNATSQDMDRWLVSNCYYHAYNIGATHAGQQLGTVGFHLQTSGPSSRGGNTIQNFTFIGIFEQGVVSNPSNAGFWLDENGSNYIQDIRILGADIFDSNRNAATAFKVTSSDFTQVGQLDLHYQEDGYARNTNLSTSVASAWSYTGYTPQLPITDGLSLAVAPVPKGTTPYPTGGLVFQSSNGTYLWNLTPDGIVHVVRTDTGPNEMWRFDMGNNRMMPANDRSGSLGTVWNRWGSVHAVQVQLGNSYSFRDLPDAPNGTVVYCSDCNASCTAGSGAGRTCFREHGIWTH